MDRRPAAPGIGLGLAAVYLAIWADVSLQAAINAGRFRPNRWMAIGREGSARLAGMGD